MDRRGFLKAGGIALGSFLIGGSLNAGYSTPSPTPLERLAEDLGSVGKGIISIFQPEMTTDTYLLTLEGELKKVEEAPKGKPSLKIYGIDGGFIPPIKSYFTRNQVGYAVQNSDDVLILDAGARTILEDKETLKKADAILLSHIHLDHVLHLWRIQNEVGKGTPVYSPNSLPGIENITKDIPSRIKSFRIDHDRTMHSIKNYAYKLDVGGKVITYTGDANYTRGLANFCKGSDMLLAEVTLNNMNIDLIAHHMCPREVIKLAKKARPRLLVMTHFKYESPDRCEKIVRKEFPNAISARPGMTIAIE